MQNHVGHRGEKTRVRKAPAAAPTWPQQRPGRLLGLVHAPTECGQAAGSHERGVSIWVSETNSIDCLGCLGGVVLIDSWT